MQQPMSEEVPREPGGAPSPPPDSRVLRVKTPARTTPPQAPAEAPSVQTGADRGDLLDALYETVVVADSSGWITDANQRALQALGYARDELMDMSLPQVFSGIGRKVMRRIREHLEHGRFTVIDVACIRKDGTRFLSETAVGRVPGGDGDRLVFSLRNIEQRRAVREQIRWEHVVIEHTMTALAVADEEGLIRYVNPALCRLWQCTGSKDLNGVALTDLFVQNAELGELRQRVAARESWDGVLVARGRDGEDRAVVVSAVPQGSGHGEGSLVLSCLEPDAVAHFAVQDGNRKEGVEATPLGELLATALRIQSTADVIRLIGQAGKSGELEVAVGPGAPAAVIAFSGGEVVRAECGGATGEAAFLRAMTMSGRLRFEEGEPAAHDPSIRRSTMALLLDAVMKRDEGVADDRRIAGA